MSEEEISLTVISDEDEAFIEEEEQEQEPSISSMEEKRIKRASIKRKKLKRAKTARSVSSRPALEIDIEDGFDESGPKLTRLEKLRSYFPKQPMYAWGTSLCFIAVVFSIIGLFAPWLTAEVTCIVPGQDTPKLHAVVRGYHDKTTLWFIVGQIVFVLIFLGIITNIASLPDGHRSKMPIAHKFLFLFYIFCAGVSQRLRGETNIEVIKAAGRMYEDWEHGDPNCAESHYVFMAEFTFWEQLFRSSIVIALWANLVTVIRSIFIAQSAKLC